MGPADLKRIHERIDETNTWLSRISTAIDTNVELCRQCRPKVMGNGKEGLDSRLVRIEQGHIHDGETRITRLETSVLMTKMFITISISLAGAVGAIAGAVVRYMTN